MIPQSAEPGHEVGDAAVRFEAGEGVGVHDVEVPVVPDGTGEGAGFVPALGRQLEEGFLPAGLDIHPDDAWLRVDLVARFGYITGALVVEAAVRRRIEAGRHHLDGKAFGRQDIPRLEAGTAVAPPVRVKALVAAGWTALQEGDTAASLAALGQLEHAARIWGAAEAMHAELHGPSKDGEIPFARLPQLSPHLGALSQHFGEPQWKAAQAEGYAAPLEETIASLEDIDTT